jgi:hypothetical protein
MTDASEPTRDTDTCFICGQPAGGGEMRDGAHVLCAWGIGERQRRRKLIPRRRGFFPSIEELDAREAEPPSSQAGP